MTTKSTCITASSYTVPETKLTRDQLAERFGAETVDKIATSSGIYERRIATNGETASDLAVRAAKGLMKKFDIDPASIDLLLFGTQTPDYLLPTTACILQDRLGLSTKTAAFDINLGCSQYVYALSVAHSMVLAGLARRALVLTGDTVSRILHPHDRSVVPLFGDAATASLVDPCPGNEGFQQFELGTDGSGAKHLIWPTSGMREPRSAQSALEETDKMGNVRRRDDMFMDGKAIFVFTLKAIAEAVQRLLVKAALTVPDVDLFIFHQGSELIIQSSANKLKIPPEKLHYKLHDVGNSGGSTVGVALTDAWLAGKVKPGMKVVLCAFGVGLSWSATMLTWPANALGAVTDADFSASPPRPKTQGG